MEEVRYHRLRPAQAVARRKARPVIYIPIGTLEWHGPHNPFGADTLQAEALAELCATKGGGMTFPPLYYGENRLEALVESGRNREAIAKEMQLPPDNFMPESFIFSSIEQTLNYSKLLLHILGEAQSLGFELAVLVAGHYPLIDHARAAALLFNQRSSHPARGQECGMLAWAVCDYLQLKNEYANAGDHGGGWETSHLMYSDPETVDLSMLPGSPQDFVGHSDNGVYQANAKTGEETLEAAAQKIIKEVNDRLEHKSRYLQHGMPLRERLWEK